MNYFFTLFRLRMKATLCSAGFLVGTIFVLCLSVLLAAALPQNAPLSLRVGVLALDAGGEKMAQLLTENGDYEILRYTDQAVLTGDVTRGTLHCGYLLETASETPVRALETADSYMRPLLDELVLAAYFEVQAPAMAADYLEQNGFLGRDAVTDFNRLREETIPMTIELETVGQTPPLDQLAARSIQPLLYAVLISVFLGMSLLTALLTRENADAAGRQLAVFSRHPVTTLLAPALGNALLGVGVLWCADFLMNRFVQVSAYSGKARLVMLCALGVTAGLFSLFAPLLRRISGVILTLLPPAVLAGVFFSGALVNPVLLPAGLGVLRFLSPAWYGLQLLEFF